MDDQFRNRFRRYDEGAPLRPRPNAAPPRPQPPAPPPQPSQLSRAPSPQPQSAPAKPLAPKSVRPNPSAPPRREPTPQREVFERPSAKLVATPSPAKKRGRAKRSKSRKLLTLISLLLIAGGAAAYWFAVKPRLHQTNPSVANKATSTQTSQKPTAKLIRLVAVGDSMAYTSINQAAQSGTAYNYAPLMSAVKPLFQKADVRLCSQTVPASGTAGGGVSGPPTFNAPPEFAKGLEDTGCNVFDLASPDINDKGQAAINASLGNFDNQASILAVSGANRSAAEQSKIRYFTVSGLKFAYLSYTTSSNVANPTPYGVDIYSDSLADAQIAEARKNATVVLVSMHWGADQADDENSSQDTIAQHLAADNADIIIGNGPHVIEPVKVLSGTNSHQTLVWFSLGNFLNSQVPVKTVIGGMAVMDLDSSNGQLHNPRLLPLYMHYEWTAQQAQRQNDADLLARKNFQLVPLDQAAALLPKSQNNTTVQAQQDRVKTIVNKYFTIPLVTSSEL